MSTEPRAHPRSTKIVEDFRRKPRWWREIFYVGVFYALYSLVRNVHGSVLSVTTAKNHAQSVVNTERSLHIFNEERIQHLFLGQTWLIKSLNVYYGTAHFVITIGVLLWLFHLKTDRYRLWRNVLFGTTLLALVGYMSYPLAPPRLLPSFYGFVDTLQSVGGLWSFDSGAASAVSNQYAAMPSLHVGWSLWCACAIAPTLRNWVGRIAVFLYPALTILAIIVTANHYWMDVFFGAAAFVVSLSVCKTIDRYNRMRKLDPIIDLRNRRRTVSAEGDKPRTAISVQS